MRRITLILALALAMIWPAISRGANDMAGMDMSHGMAPPAGPAASAAAATGPAPSVAVALTKEEGQRMISATVTLNGKPLPGAKVEFFLDRTFGKMSLGHDESDDSGVAAVNFPGGLSGGTSGTLHVTATIAAGKSYANAIGETTVPADVTVNLDPDPFPRALWAPHAPLALIVSWFGALAGVWTTYVFVLTQLRALRKEGNR